jgi:hypothetical protein
MKTLIISILKIQLFLSMLLVTSSMSWANSIIWSCSRSEPKQTVFEGIKAFHLENLSIKDDYTTSITLLDLYAVYNGESIQMGKLKLSACSLPPHDPLQANAAEMLGYNSKDLLKASGKKSSALILIPSIHEMQKCLHENHPAVGFFPNVVETEHVGPCF